MSEISEYLITRYEFCIAELGSANEPVQSISSSRLKSGLDVILKHSESAKGVLTVVLTSLVYKIFYKDQDIRYHQANMEGGYSGRSFDANYITPFLKQNNFPAMAESGWLTRSLEQNMPYDKKYPGKISPPYLKEAFLDLIEEIQNECENEMALNYILQYLILQRNSNTIQLAKPANLQINDVIKKVENHFNSKYASEGAARLPVLALQAVYSCLAKELKRFNGKKLLPLEKHTSSDLRSGRIGDIEVQNEDGTPFEAVEVKFKIEITKQLVSDSYSKFSASQADRYYLLSTAGLSHNETKGISEEILKIKNIHGCQVITNGVIKSLEYYLRLLTNTKDFISFYVDLLENDSSIKFEHKAQWNKIVNNI